MDCIVQIVILVQMVRRPFDVALHGCPKPVQQPAVETENEFLPDCGFKGPSHYLLGLYRVEGFHSESTPF